LRRAAAHPAHTGHGDGETCIAFQLAWKLFYARWNLSREPTRRPRILFFADRNILANQACNAFSAFPGGCAGSIYIGIWRSRRRFLVSRLIPLRRAGFRGAK
jgi:hypothetical protein